MGDDHDEQRQLEHVRHDLLGEFEGALPELAVNATFDRALSQFDGARVRTYLPVLVRKATRLQLRRQVPPG